jgi:hypothetical protein
MTPTHYKIVPISEKPEKEGIYIIFNSEHPEYAVGWPFMSEEWSGELLSRHYTHWLKPVEGILVTEKELPQYVENRLLQMMKDNPSRVLQYLTVIAGREARKTNAGSLTLSCEADIENERFIIKNIITVETINPQGDNTIKK